MMRILASFLLINAAVAISGRTSVTPLQKVTELLSGMLEKGKQAKHQEEVEFSKYSEWCDNMHSDTTRDIERGGAAIEELGADIAKASADAEVLSGEVAGLQAEVAKDDAARAQATEQRKTENADFLATQADYATAIDQIIKARGVLKARTPDVAQTAKKQALLQLRASPFLASNEKESLDSLLSVARSGQTPEANAYEFQSGSVLDLLDGLEKRFRDEKLALEKAEMNAKHNFQMLAQQWTDNINANEQTATKKTEFKAGRVADGAKATADKAATEKVKAQDEQTLQDTAAQCAARKDEFGKNQAVRADEITAIEKAMEVLNSDAVKGNDEKHDEQLRLIQVMKSSFAQLRNTENPESRARLVAYLQSRAKQLDSHFLSVMAAHASADAFAKIKKMISALINKLMDEANAEADEYAFCQTELATNKQTRENAAAEVEQLRSQLDQLTAETAQLSSDIDQLSSDVSELNKQRSVAEANRAEEKTTNAQTVADAKEAQEAVTRATLVLKEFYGGAAALLQRGATTSVRGKAPYTGMTGDSTGIFGLLEVLLSDFARLESSTSDAEAAAASSHEKFMAESSETIAVKDSETEHKTSKKTQNEEAIRGAQQSLERTQDELDKANTYNEKLQQDCVDHGLSYKDRKERREQEIQSLQEALQILGGSMR